MISKERLLHLCFDEEEFKHEAFVPAKFLVQKRRHVSLETLQKDLRLYLGHLKEEVVQLINTDLYDNFLSVSKKLAGIDGELARICEPLPEMINKVDKAKRKLEESRSTVQKKLLECRAIDQTRQFIVLVLKLTIIADKVEDWLEAHSEGNQLLQFTRIAVECRQLQADELLLRAMTADQQEERQTLLARTTQLRLRFEELLDDRFVHVLRMQQELLLTEADDSSLELRGLEEQAKVYLECYHVLQKEDTVAELFQSHVCKEVVDKVLSWTVTGSNRGAAPEALQPLFQELLQEISRCCLPLVKVSQAVAGHFCLIKAAWKCITEVILKRMQHIFSPGIPNKFHIHYTAAHQLLSGLEANITDPEELQGFRHSEEMEAWNNKWLLSVYTALRQKELMAELNTLLQQHLQPAAWNHQSAEANFHFEQVLGLHRLILWLWGDQVWLYPIGESLMKMTLKALLTLERWLANFWVAPPPAPPTPPPQVLDEEGSPTATQPAEVMGKLAVVGLIVGEMQLRDHVALHCDLTRLQSTLQDDLKRIVCLRMNCGINGTPDPLEVAVVALCGHCSAIIRRPLSAVQGMVVRAVAKECVDTLVPPLKSITSLYRMTKKPVPKRFSFFIPTILSALQNFKEACTATAAAPPKYALPVEVVAECVRAVLVEVTTTYHNEAKALLLTARKAEKAVSTLRKKQKKAEEDRPMDAGEGREEMSDTDKIFVQIHLDIQEYGHQAQTLFGMSPDFEPYRQLCSLVRRAAWLLGEIADEPPDALDG